MKIKVLWMFAILILPFLNSCDKEEEIEGFNNPNATWTDSATLKFTTDQDLSGFVYNVNNSTGEAFWGQTEAKFNVTFVSPDVSVEAISKIDFYIFAEEQVGDNFNYLGGTSGNLIASVSNPTEVFEISLDKSEVYNAFSSQFSGGRTDLVPGDLFELRWVITGKDGNVADSRTDCKGINCLFGFSAKEKLVDTWVGEFEATWTEVGPGTVTYSYSDVVVGAKRMVEFVPGGNEGEYDILDMSFGGAYGGPRDGTMTWDADTGTITIIYAESYYTSQYELVSVTPEVLTLKWTNNFTSRYAEYGTVELRRNDGLVWPEINEIINY
ncbi:hypothetical protein [Aegicerativicinus sediminis]|uniref:hypothetical protein n=1 Tax=Aegicerativicinus sediminis TaxID=2893202 RepID=UPI001E3E3A5D|nr:hypothetical protein [Aegicerativicinus sediminis]